MPLAPLQTACLALLLTPIAMGQEDPWQRAAKNHERNVVTILDADGVFDPESGRILADRNVNIEDDRILAVRPKSERRPAGARVIRLPGRILAPGFIHCGNPHFLARTGSPYLETPPQPAWDGPSPWLAAGFTTICEIDEGAGHDPLLIPTAPREMPTDGLQEQPNLLLRFQRKIARAGLPALIEVHSRAELLRALDLHAHAVETHVALDPDLLREICERQVVLLPGHTVAPGIREGLRRAARAEISLAVGGTDPIPARSGPLRAMIRLQEMGMDPREAIRAASLGSAQLARLPQRGRIVPGYFADLVAPPVEAFENLHALSDLDFVMRSGEIVIAPQSLETHETLAVLD